MADPLLQPVQRQDPYGASIGPMSAGEKAHAEDYIAQNKSLPAGLKALAGRYGAFTKRALNQVPKSLAQTAQDITLHIADPETIYLKAQQLYDEERRLAALLPPGGYVDNLAERVVDKIDSLLRSPEAVGDLLGSYGLGKATRGPALFQNTYVDEAVIGTKAATELLGKDYAEQPKAWSEVLDAETFGQKYTAAKDAARGSDRALAPLWKATDQADEIIAARLETLSRQLAAALAAAP